VSADGEAVICCRVESDHETRNGGWLHKTNEDRPARYLPPPTLPPTPLPDFSALWRRWSEQTEPHHLDGFAMSLGVDTDALRALGCAWSGRAWAFPMRNETGRMVGLRLRSDDGRKWAVRGSRSALFYSPAPEPAETLYVVEGPTDAAAALTLGLPVVGRPSCLGQEEMLAALVRRLRARAVCIIADADEAGQRGAERLRNALPARTLLWTPPCKDLREFVQFGGTVALIESATKDLMWSSSLR
jgi:5S rRNA maturation endonuclease (ribonuclease M5)